LFCRIVAPMRVLSIVHDEDAGPGVFDDVLSAARADVETWLPARQPGPGAPADAYGAILTFGGAAHPHQEDRHPWLATEKRFLAEALAARVPMLGVCLGAELIAEADGARSQRLPQAEIGWHEVTLTPTGVEDPVLGRIGESFLALEWHSYEVALPSRGTELARGDNCLQAYRIGNLVWGLQFHAEVTPEDFQHWLDHYTDDEDAVALGIEPRAIAEETRGRMAEWNDLGRGICERFLVVAKCARLVRSGVGH